MIETFEFIENRAIITLAGPDRKSLLQGIITNDINGLKDDQGLYAALLSPQGKFLHDFFLFEKDDIIYLDCEKARMEDLFRRLLMYRLRSAVEIIDQSAKYNVITSKMQIENAFISFKDPRHDDMGFRAIVEKLPQNLSNDNGYHMRRISLGIAEGTNDFIVDKSTLGEGHFEQIHGLDFNKGCYVGQEVTARMKYRGSLKKALFPVDLAGDTPEFGTPIIDDNDAKVGHIRSSCDHKAIALFALKSLTFNKDYHCGDIKITPYKPNWMEDTDHD